MAKNKSKSKPRLDETPAESAARPSLKDSPFALAGAAPVSPREKRFVWGAWLLLCILSLTVIPISPMARQWGSWDAMHSGRRFAEQGFFASKLQPIWSPSNGAPTYVTYTHYPPLPYWGAGIVESFVSTPQGRIHAVNHLLRILGISALALSYVLMRRLNCSIAASALVVIITASTTDMPQTLERPASMWREMCTQAVFYGWVIPFLLGSVIFYLKAIRPDCKKPILPAVWGTLCCLGAALCAYQAWSWYPTMLAALFFTGAFVGDKKLQRKRIFWIWFTACWTIALAIGIRIGINYWHFGSLEAVYRDFVEAYQTRSTGAGELTLKENIINYYESTAYSSSRPSLLWEFVKIFPPGMARVCLPAPPLGWLVLALMAGLGVTGFLLRKRIAPSAVAPEVAPASEEKQPPEINRRGILLALALAPLTFVVACPRITVEQWQGETYWMFPAWIALCGVAIHYALSLLELLIKRMPTLDLRRYATAAVAFLAIAAASINLVWTSTIDPDDAQITIKQAEEIASAIKHHEGIVFTNLINQNPVMFCLPLDTKTSVKPVISFKHHKLDAPFGMLVDSRFKWKVYLPADFEEHWHIEPKVVPNLPDPFKFFIISPKAAPQTQKI